MYELLTGKKIIYKITADHSCLNRTALKMFIGWIGIISGLQSGLLNIKNALGITSLINSSFEYKILKVLWKY